MRYGKFLKKDGTIGFVAPSFGCNIEPYRSGFDRAQKVFAQMSYRSLPGPNAYEGSGIGISNSPVACAEEFTDWYERDDTDVLISCGGGELMCETIGEIDFERIRKAPAKWFMGYSDNTNLTFLLPTLCDTAAIYGPCAATFGMDPWHRSLYDAMEILTGQRRSVSGYKGWEKESLKTEDNPFASYNITEKSRYICLPGGETVMEGRLLGGCLDTLSILCGTVYDRVREFADRYKEDSVIWFLESCDLTPMGVRRALWQLSRAGWFDNAAGFIIGRPYHYGEEMLGLDQYSAVTGILGERNLPLVMDADIGHLPPMMPLITGSKALVRANEKELHIEMSLV